MGSKAGAIVLTLNRSIFLLGMVAVCAVQSVQAHADEQSLEAQLDQLALPSNQAPVNLSQEKLYSVQSRFIPLKSRFELSVGGAHNFSGDRFLSTNDVGGTLRYHLTDRWSLGASVWRVTNSLTSSGNALLADVGRLPDSTYASLRADVSATYNLFYGKFRLGMDKVLYFDQYVSLGAGRVNRDNGATMAYVGDIGFVFWLGGRASLRLGMKDYYYREDRRLSSGMQHNFMGHVDIGILLGGSGGAAL